jgi:hypothetical protein
MIGAIHYLNSGDWVESLTALAETNTGEWKIIHYHDWLASLETANRGVSEDIRKLAFS